MNPFLPISKKDMKERGWEELDFVLVTGDAYVDHSSFGTAIIGRVLERFGYKVGIIAQPNWQDAEDFKKLGRPRLGFLIGSGNIDSMVNHYTTAKRRRRDDVYSPGGQGGLRPDRAVIVYAQRAREAYKDVPVVLGGIEASLRRLGHYDYWENKIRRSVLLDSKADLIMYGMGEKVVVELAEALEGGIPIEEITFIPGTVYKTTDKDRAYDAITLPSYEEICQSKKSYAKSFLTQSQNMDHITGKTLIESYGDLYVVQNPAQPPLTGEELDAVYELPFVGTYHPIYEAAGGIPAIEEVKFSLTSNRGCFGNCNFCALAFHQGRVLQARSQKSLVKEAKEMTNDPDFKGYIHDVGGPTANFRQGACDKQVKDGVCKNKQCLFPTPCKNLKIDHSDYINVLRELRSIPKVKKVFVRSGIRYDYVLADKNDDFLNELCEHHISGQLRVAPEHISNKALSYMGKPNSNTYIEFVKRFEKANEKTGKKQFVVPYLMSSHPGCELDDAIELALYLKKTGHTPQQVQDFYPTPSTIATCMYYTEIDPRTMKPVYVAKEPKDKAMQRALMQFKKRENYNLVHDALVKAGREDLIGVRPECLISPKGNKKR
ncbi:MAG TPA: YgiQ family radical SAM protein [Epulopiscium sp.]|nr:YgiQ family radical SAM protein [Candidatus Epulonipiscium sp.]